MELSGDKPAGTSAPKKTTKANEARKPRAQKDLSRVTLPEDEAVEQLLGKLEVPPSRPAKTGFSWGNLFLLSFGGPFPLW